MPSLDLELVPALKRALDDDALVLHFQPEVDLASGAVVGMEALLRWQHPQRGLLWPAAFSAPPRGGRRAAPPARGCGAPALSRRRGWRRAAALPRLVGAGAMRRGARDVAAAAADGRW